MAESACLLRSFSHPSHASSHFTEGDHLRALGESISFGRYMPDSLAWEKFSTFTHNRYLEEVEKYSKPGSVAKMKAFFETHYKRFASKKPVAKPEQANDLSSNAAKVEVSDVDAIESSSFLNSETTQLNTHSAVNNLQGERVSDLNLVFDPPVSPYRSTSTAKKRQNEESETSKAGVSSNAEESSAQVHVNESHYAKKNDATIANPQSKVSPKGDDQVESRKVVKSTDSSLKRSTYGKMSKLSSSIARIATPIRPAKEDGTTPKSRKCTKDLNVIKESTPADARKTTVRKILTPSLKIIRDSLAPSRTPSRASVSKVSSLPPVTPKREPRSNTAAVDQSSVRSKTASQKLQSPSSKSMTTLSSSGLKARPSITFYSFSFRTEERAAKRREFFLKMQEKEAEKSELLDKAKIKPKIGPRNSSQCTRLKAKTTVDRAGTSKNDDMKIPQMQTQSPKPGRKQASNLVPNTRSQRCQRPAAKTDESSLAAEKKLLPSTRLLGSQPKKNKGHENASPNIR